MKRIVILGVTGTVGAKAAEYIINNPQDFELVGVSAHTRASEAQNKYQCPLLQTDDPDVINRLDDFIVSTHPDIIINAISGFVGMEYSLKVIKHSITLALANKESIVCGGPLFMKYAKEHNTSVIPVDSEHNSIFQLLEHTNPHNVQQITLTASGGPFWQRASLRDVTLSEALTHPNWVMGPKITIDSATMVNKVLELFEAMYLFDFQKELIQALIEPSSTIHALITLHDGTIHSLMSTTDMVMPISHALHYPNRALMPPCKMIQLEDLNIAFHQINSKIFKIFDLYNSITSHYHYHSILINAANEVAVEAFIQNQLSFGEIYDIIDYCLDADAVSDISSFEDIYELDKRIRTLAYAYLEKG